MKEIEAGEWNTIKLEPKIIKSDRKSIGIIVNLQGDLIVRAPKFVSDREIRRLIESKEKWIRSMQEKQRHSAMERKHLKIEDGAVISFLGEEYLLRASDVKKVIQNKYIQKNEKDLQQGLNMQDVRMNAEYDTGISGNILVPVHKDFEKTLMKWLKEQALYILIDSAEHYAEQLGVTYAGLKLSNARTRWGTCNSQKVIRFSWKLIMCPLPIIDYVVVHELCHLKHMNHSRDFWKCVEDILPNYKALRKELKEHNYLMDL